MISGVIIYSISSPTKYKIRYVNPFFKVLTHKARGQSPDTHKMFSKNFMPKSYDYYDYMDVWYFTFYFRPFDHSWFFHWGDEIKNQNDFPNWFQEWWLFFGATQDILCPQIKEG